MDLITTLFIIADKIFVIIYYKVFIKKFIVESLIKQLDFKSYDNNFKYFIHCYRSLWFYHFVEIYRDNKFVITTWLIVRIAGEAKVSLGHHKFEISRSKSVARVTLSPRENNKSYRFTPTSFVSSAESVLHIKRDAIEIARTCIETVNDTSYASRRNL